MPEASDYFDEIDSLRLQRARELSAVKLNFTTDPRPDPFAIKSKSVVVLAYANWEGFYNECVTAYVDFLSSNSVQVSHASWNLLVGALSAEFNSLKDRGHSGDAKRIFVEQLRQKLSCRFDAFDKSVILSRSNLNFSTLNDNFRLMSLDISPFQRSRIRLDRELVGWRHAVAHGSPPDLQSVDVVSHVDFASALMLEVADTFQAAMLAHA